MEEQEQYHSFLEYMAKGWMRPDKLPTKFQLEAIKKDWFDFFFMICLMGKVKLATKKWQAVCIKATIFRKRLCKSVKIN